MSKSVMVGGAVGLVIGVFSLFAGASVQSLMTEQRCVSVSATPGPISVTGSEWLGMLADGWVLDGYPPSGGSLFCLHRSRLRLP